MRTTEQIKEVEKTWEWIFFGTQNLTLEKITKPEELNIVENLVIRPNYNSNVEGVEITDNMVIETELIDFYEIWKE